MNELSHCTRVMLAFKTKLDVNNKQAGFFARCEGTARFVYNWGLAERIELYNNGEEISYYSQKKRFNALKKEQFPWIYEVPYAVVEATLKNLDTAYQNFYRKNKRGEVAKKVAQLKAKGKYERFCRNRLKRNLPAIPFFATWATKSRHNSFQLTGVKVYNDRVKIPRLGYVKLAESGYIPTDAEKYGVYATISKTAGDWYISVLAYVDVETIETNGDIIGVDFGIKDLAVCSNGVVFENPHPLRNAQKRLKRLQRELSRRERGGQNWKKTLDKLRKAHAKVVNIRRHALHEISSYLVYESGASVIVLEDLNVDGMNKNHHLAQAVMDVSFSELRRQIEYKAEWAGVEVVFVDRWYPSSKTCSRCGCIKSDLELSDRVYRCPDCGLVIDRDMNAALNLAAIGRHLLETQDAV